MISTNSFRLYFISCISFGLFLICHAKVVKISNGLIQGRKLLSHQNNTFYAYQQIPYARPPTGKYRFKEPVEPLNWEGILNATKNTKVCVQFQENDDRETEDCLYLNVYSPCIPTNSSAELLPVLFWIHGGIFLNGHGSFDKFGPQYFMDYNVVVVTINYRLGPLGFAYTKDNIIPGNIGLKDQNLALKWVNKNIACFKGDPERVIIAGQSAGAGAVGYHVISTMSKGLFSGAIQESGSPLCSKMFQKHPEYFTYKLAESFDPNFTSMNSSQELLNVLLGASIDQLKKHSNLQIPADKYNSAGSYGSTVWNPVIEIKTDSAFISKPMDYSFKRGYANQVPVLMGFNSEEELHYDISKLETKKSYYDADDSILINGNLNISQVNRKIAGKKIKKLYTNQTFQNDFGALVKFMTDVRYTNGICRQARLHSAYTEVYLYQFSYSGLVAKSQEIVPGTEKVGHTEELKFLFVNRKDVEINWRPVDRKMQKILLTMWTNFLKYADPTPTKCQMFGGVTWTKVDPYQLNYLNINQTLEMMKAPRRYFSWERVFRNYANDIQETF